MEKPFFFAMIESFFTLLLHEMQPMSRANENFFCVFVNLCPFYPVLTLMGPGAGVGSGNWKSSEFVCWNFFAFRSWWEFFIIKTNFYWIFPSPIIESRDLKRNLGHFFREFQWIHKSLVGHQNISTFVESFQRCKTKRSRCSGSSETNLTRT